jgi:hypothetical protein
LIPLSKDVSISTGVSSSSPSPFGRSHDVSSLLLSLLLPNGQETIPPQNS